MIDLSIVIVTYNSEHEASSVVQSIQETVLHHSYEIIVVDNASQDNTVSILKRYKNVVLLEQKKNLGYGAANNLGVKQAKGRYLLFLNPDTIVQSNAVDLLIQAFQEHTSYGIISALLTDQHGNIQVQGGEIPTLANVARWMFFLDDLPGVSTVFASYQSKPSLRSNSFIRRGWVGGTACIISHELFKKLRGWDEHFFMYAEDVELCMRVREQGFEVGIVTGAVVQHQQHASAGKAAARIGELKGLLYIWKKHYSAWQYPYLLLLLRLGAWLRVLIFGILQGNGELKRIYIEAGKDLRVA